MNVITLKYKVLNTISYILSIFIIYTIFIQLSIVIFKCF
ncbi:hypothetical protein BE25_0215 [Staphylococcus phage vB_SepM_BE25]|nr:hypothetical protein BE25_0215 [Staphylococcus phage vB_SepM_BE25]